MSGSEAAMPDSADAVVIGAGALGAATAFHLAQQGKRVVLLDRCDLASQSSKRAAGLSQQVQVDDVLAGLAVRGADALIRFAELTGVEFEVVVNGSVKLARHEHDAEQLREEVRRGQALGAAIEIVSPAAATAVAPYLDASNALEISYNPADLYIEHPATLPLAFISALRERGGLALAHTEVTDIIVDGDAIQAVETTRGRIETPVVVDAGGAWTRILGALVGREISLWPVRHQLCITEPLAEVDPTHATVRVMDAKVYVRPAKGGLMFGAYEPDPLALDPRERAPDFELSALEVEMRPLELTMRSVAQELPTFQRAKIAELRGGLPTMTPDGYFLVDRMPGMTGFYVASGCNVGGLSISPPIGEDLASWIVAGTDRPATLEPFRLDRFDGRYQSDEELRDACVATYTHKYDEEEVVKR
jgi:glycine/D-amino acid oxidase-like deaminating enzyme